MSKNNDNGAASAEYSPNKPVVLSNESTYDQSNYIVALSLWLGLEGLHYPAALEEGAIRYEFDFYHKDSGRLIKIFQRIDQDEIDHYLRIVTPEILLTIDSSKAKCGACESCLDADDEICDRVSDWGRRINGLLIWNASSILDYDDEDGQWLETNSREFKKRHSIRTKV